jgi:type IV fimbrial biogenesis protein FimT
MSTSLKSRGGAHGTQRPAFGFTLVELMMAITVVAILLVIAVPSFRDAALGSRLSAVANNLLASVQLARSEAIKRNQTVTLCASANGTSCAGSGDWEQGWIMLDADNNVIKRQEALPAGLKLLQAGTIVAPATTFLAPLQFQPLGIGATAGSFTVCRASPLGSQERVVTVTATGTAYVTITNNGACP